MANEQDAVTKKAKIEIDASQAKRNVENLTKSVSSLENRLKALEKYKSIGSTLNQFDRKNLAVAAGFRPYQLNNMSENEFLKVQTRYTKELTSAKKELVKAQTQLSDITKSSELAELKRLDDIKRKEQDLLTLERQKTRSRIENYKEQVRSSLKFASSRGIYGLAEGLSDSNLGSTLGARARFLWNQGAVGGAVRSQASRFASQALWGIQGRILSTAYNTIRSGMEAPLKMEDRLSETQAIAGSTSGTMNQLAKSIYEVGSNSRFTTEELTKTTTILAQAGYSAEDISKLLGSVNSLATATGTDLRTSVDLLTSSMSLWTSQTSDASKMVDALVVAVNSSKAEISSIQKGMQYAGAAASQMGMSFNETVAAMSAVTNAGLKTRSIMGTGLRAVLTELSDPSTKLQKELEKVGLTISDVNIRTQGFANVMKTLSEAGFGAESAFRGLDRQAASFYLALKSQRGLNDQILEQMERRGVAEKAEQVRMDTTVAQIGRLKNAWFEIFATAGAPVNTAFKAVLKEVADGSTSLAEALRSVSNEAKDADTVLEKTTSELDSMKTSAKALSEEMWKLSKQNFGGDANAAAKAHANLTDRFNNERKVVQALSRDYAQLKGYMIDIAVAQENENVDIKRREVGAQLQKVRSFPLDLISSLSKDYGTNLIAARGEMLRLSNLAGVSIPENTIESRMGVTSFLEGRLAPKLQTMPIEQLQNLIYNFQSGSAVRNSLERLLTSRESIATGMSYIQGSPAGGDLRKYLERISDIVSVTSGFMSGKEYSEISSRLKDWRGETAQVDITSVLSKIDTFRAYVKELDELASQFPQSLQIQAQTSTARENLFENIQTLETQITNVATKAMEDIERDLKNMNQTKKQSVIEKFVEKLEGMLGVSESGKSWLDATIEKLQSSGADEGLIESLKQLREKLLSGLLKSVEQIYESTIENANLKYDVSGKERNYISAKRGYNQGQIAKSNLDYIQAQLNALRDARKTIEGERTTTYKEYSDEQFKALTNPISETVVKLELDEDVAIEEANRLGVNGSGFWEQTGNAMGQATTDFFRSINQQSVAYELTLTGLKATSEGLKDAFKSIIVEGTSVTEAFRSMAQSILQTLANKAIDKGVDYLAEGIGAAFNFAIGGLGSSSGSSGGSSGNVSSTASSWLKVPETPSGTLWIKSTAAIGGYVTKQGIRHFSIGGPVNGRDSVPALLMPGEYVMKKSAVDMIGKETLDAMNQATSRASNDKASNVRESKKPSPVVTNVYVVQDKQEAGMTPNDVVVAVGRDILQGGQTRQLIQQVVQGRY